jgi:hypothetical protein
MSEIFDGIFQDITGVFGQVFNAVGSLGASFINPAGEVPVYNVGISTGRTVPSIPGQANTLPNDAADDMLPWEVGPPNGETDFYRIDTRLQALETRIIYIGVPDPLLGGQRRWWELNGKYAGAQGLMCGEQFAGLMHSPFDLKIESGAYEIGGTWERTDWNPKTMSMAAMVNATMGPNANSFAYRMLEQAWWNSWDTDSDGWLGVYTRTHGWRFIPVRLANMSKTAFEIDPVSHNNCFMEWDMDILALYPFYAKRSITQTWTNTSATSTVWNEIIDTIESVLATLIADLGPLAQGSSQVLANALPGRQVGSHTFSIANRGTWGAYPKYIVSPPGIAWIQNGWNADGSPQMLQLPLLTPEDGYVLVDTDPDARTLTCVTDPVDPLFMQILQNSSLLEILLGPEINSTKPIWQQFKYSFTEAALIPPQTVASLTAWHSDESGTVTCIMPQQYKMAWG